ncbi:MAG: L-2-hydroxyglutarate oxidase [Gemmatimonadota bacterium]|nr:MAG: L-2-hydroxyglutarate oxidase [Gemmatimonadota bacterium]
MTKRPSPDILVIGGGVIGLRLALEVKRRAPGSRVTLIEKERRCGLHASGRNSGVLHAGFYYAADSFKARFSREGNARLTDYCAERGLRIKRCGKLVVASDASQLGTLEELLRRAERNGVELQKITASEASEIEPKVKTHERALYSPSTSVIDPAEVMSAFAGEAEAAGVDIRTGTAYLGRRNGSLLTGDGPIAAGYVVNAAGLYADRIARDFGFAEHHTILPFKGLYLESRPGSYALNTNIYPLPNLGTPFLGVHLTVTVDGRVTIGPTAVPALWREQYRLFDNFKIREFLQIFGLESRMFLGDRASFRSVALREIPKYYKPRMVRQAAALAHGVRATDFKTWAPAGIRAQLVDLRDYRLENDFRLEGDERSLHVLNAVSPAFTCALPFAEFVADEIERLTR